MTEDEYWQEQQDRYVQEQQAAFYEWLGWFDFGQRALAQMERDAAAVECGAVEMFGGFLQKQWEQRDKIVRCC